MSKSVFLFASVLASSCASCMPVNADNPTEVSTPASVGTPSEDEANYYVDRISDQSFAIEDLTGNSLDGQQSSHDSDLLNRALTKLSKEGGGVLLLRKPADAAHIYLRDIVMTSNVHLKIAPDIVIRPFFGAGARGGPKSVNIFELGRSGAIENFAITPMDEDSADRADWYTVDIPNGRDKGVRIVNAVAVENFKLSGMKVKDSFTKFSNITFNSAGAAARGIGKMPYNGIVKNMVTDNNHVGYGLVQTRSAINMLYKNLDSGGGVTLRLESGQVTKTAEASLDGIVGRDIVTRNGAAALTLSPHRITQGIIDVRGISAINSTHAVQIAAGFFDRKKNGVDNLGTFDSRSTIGDIRLFEGGQTSQVKSKNFGAYSCEVQADIRARYAALGQESVPGPSIAVVRDNADPAFGCQPDRTARRPQGCYTVNLELPDPANVSGIHLGDDMIFHMAADKKICRSR